MASNDSSESRPTLRFGILLAPYLPWVEYLALVGDVELLGFDSIWVPDHFVMPGRPEAPWLEGWSTLAALAAATRTIRIGTLVSNFIYRNPALLARQAMTIDQISGGRLELGIGATWDGDRSHPMTGVPVWRARERVDRFLETIQIVDLALRQRVSTFEGKYYQMEEAHLFPGPVQLPRPPLTLAAHGPRTLKITARYADSWSTFDTEGATTGQESVDITRQRNDRLTELVEAAGRDPSAILRSFTFGWTPDRPYESLDAFHETIGLYREAGINEFVFTLTPGIDELKGRYLTDMDFLERIATEAIPAIRQA